MDATVKLALETIEISKQALIFAPSRASAEKTAEETAKLTSLSLPELSEEILHAASTPTKQCKRLASCIKKGIAFHHAGLLQKQREIIEREFKSGKIKIICATPTLAAGMNLPAFRVIIKSLKRYSGSWGMNWIPVLEYLQMSGRAGRPEYEKEGEAISIAKNEAEKKEIFEKYICGVPEEIYSKLAVEPVLRTYLLSLIASGIIYNEETMNEFFSKTFWAHQFEDIVKLKTILHKMLSLLEKWGFIILDENKKDDFMPASLLNKLVEQRIRATRLGKRVSELYLDPLTARHVLDCLEQFDETKTAFSLLQMVCHTLEMRPLLRTKVKEEEEIQRELVKNYDQLLEPEPSAFDPDYDSFIDSLKTALFFEAWINEKDEEYLLEKYDIRPGEIRTKQDIADWLLYAAEELSLLQEYQKAIAEIRKLRARIKEGVKEELLILLKLKGIGRIRARKLYTQGIKDMKDVKKTDITTLSQILGKTIALNIKEQVGEEVKEIPKGTRKGQTSLRKY